MSHANAFEIQPDALDVRPSALTTLLATLTIDDTEGWHEGAGLTLDDALRATRN